MNSLLGNVYFGISRFRCDVPNSILRDELPKLLICIFLCELPNWNIFFDDIFLFGVLMSGGECSSETA